MAIPSFDELLAQARQIAATEESRVTGTALAEGLSQGITKSFLRPPEGTKSYQGYINEFGKYIDRPYKSDQSLLEKGFDKLFGREPYKPPPYSTGLTQEQASEFRTKQALEESKQIAERKLQDMKTSGMSGIASIRKSALVEAAQIRAKQAVSGISNIQQKLISEELSNVVYGELENNLGITFTPEQKTQLTLGEISEFRKQGWIGDNLLKLLGLYKDPFLGGLKEGAVKEAQEIQTQVQDVRKKKSPLKGMPSFNSNQEAATAFKDGRIKPGDTAIINGVETLIQ